MKQKSAEWFLGSDEEGGIYHFSNSSQGGKPLQGASGSSAINQLSLFKNSSSFHRSSRCLGGGLGGLGVICRWGADCSVSLVGVLCQISAAFSIKSEAGACCPCQACWYCPAREHILSLSYISALSCSKGRLAMVWQEIDEVWLILERILLGIRACSSSFCGEGLKMLGTGVQELMQRTDLRCLSMGKSVQQIEDRLKLLCEKSKELAAAKQKTSPPTHAHLLTSHSFLGSLQERSTPLIWQDSLQQHIVLYSLCKVEWVDG